MFGNSFLVGNMVEFGSQGIVGTVVFNVVKRLFAVFFGSVITMVICGWIL
jgi:putative Ca2+/H+ antiporter (TMEM165/GDT1 family)